jgi:hypothetical protein
MLSQLSIFAVVHKKKITAGITDKIIVILSHKGPEFFFVNSSMIVVGKVPLWWKLINLNISTFY